MTTKKKVWKNILSGLFNQFFTLALGIVIPRLVLVNLGSESNGLINSTNQALTYLALLEGGMGLSITQALYAPVAKENHKEINAIMSAANVFYRNVGTWYLLGLIIISVVYTFTIPTSISRTVVFGVVILTGLPQVINFFFQGKYRTLISVYGKGYVLTNFNSFIYLGTSTMKIVLLLHGFGLVAIQLMFFIVSLIQLCFIAWYVKKEFPWIDLRVKPAMEKIGQRSSVFIHQISGFIFSNTDILILTYLCDLKVASVYALYNMLFSMVGNFISNITGSVLFKMGQTFQSNRAEYLRLQNAFETINMVLVFSCQFVISLSILPFLKLYTRGVTDISYLDHSLPYLFAMVHLLQSGRFSSQKVIEYAGEFRSTQWHAAAEMILNLVVSIAGVIWCGIYGVLYGTIVALLFRSVIMIHFACKRILCISQIRVYFKWGINMLFFIIGQVLIRLISVQLNTYFEVIIYAVALMVIALLFFGGGAVIYDNATCKMIWKRIGMRGQ